MAPRRQRQRPTDSRPTAWWSQYEIECGMEGRPAKRAKVGDTTRSSVAPKARSSYTKPLKILVGPDEEAFISFEDVLCASSSYFKSACSKDWKENQEKTVRLAHAEPDVFRTYLDWVLAGKLDDDRLEQGDLSFHEWGGPVERERSCKINHNLCKLWILADYLQDVSCKNGVIRSLDERHFASREDLSITTHKDLSHEDFCIARATYELLDLRTLPGSSIFRWAIGWLSMTYSAENIENYPASTQLAVLKNMVRVRDEECIETVGLFRLRNVDEYLEAE